MWQRLAHADPADRPGRGCDTRAATATSMPPSSSSVPTRHRASRMGTRAPRSRARSTCWRPRDCSRANATATPPCNMRPIVIAHGSLAWAPAREVARAEAARRLRDALDHLLAWPERSGKGRVWDSFWSAWDAFAGARSYQETIERAIAYGNDTDTTAAIAGGLAGIYWGIDGIPKSWLDGMRGRDVADPLVDRLLETPGLAHLDAEPDCGSIGSILGRSRACRLGGGRRSPRHDVPARQAARGIHGAALARPPRGRGETPGSAPGRYVPAPRRGPRAGSAPASPRSRRCWRGRGSTSCASRSWT